MGLARIQRVESYPSQKTLRRCPECGTTGIKERRLRQPVYRCSKGHEFAEPQTEQAVCTKLEAHFKGEYLPAAQVVPSAKLRQACVRPADQLSIQQMQLARIKADVVRAVPGSELLFADEQAILVPSSLDRANETIEGYLGVRYRRADEETTAEQRLPFEVDPIAIERASRAHARLQNMLAESLIAQGLAPRSPSSTEPLRPRMEDRFAVVRFRGQEHDRLERGAAASTRIGSAPAVSTPARARWKERCGCAHGGTGAIRWLVACPLRHTRSPPPVATTIARNAFDP